MRWSGAVLLLAAWGGAWAQQGGPPQGQVTAQVAGYPVTGRVLCGDTQRPARFAQVTLLPASEDEGEFGGRGGRRFSARTDLDGNFLMSGVPQGDYFLVGQLTGYVNDSQAVESVLNAGGDTSALPAGVPRVHVGAGGASTEMALQRGGVIAGLVSWDDGSPAAGVQVSVQPPPQTGTTGTATTQTGLQGLGRGGFGQGIGFGGFGGGQTDDRGRFRLTGLAPGSYLVRASVQAPAPVRAGTETRFARILNIAVYAPDKVRRTDAVAVTLAGAEERDDVNVVLGLAGLHNVAGTVSASGATVRSGTVTLSDQTDSSLSRTGVINGDGSFAVPYVPPGNYTLRVNASTQAQATGGRGGQVSSDASGVRFQPLQAAVTVTDGDLTGLTFTVTAATQASSGTP